MVNGTIDNQGYILSTGVAELDRMFMENTVENMSIMEVCPDELQKFLANISFYVC